MKRRFFNPSRLISKRTIRRWLLSALFIPLTLGICFCVATLFAAPRRDEGQTAAGKGAAGNAAELTAESDRIPASTHAAEDGGYPQPAEDSRFSAFPEKLRPGEPVTILLSFPKGSPELAKTRRAELVSEEGKILGKARFFLLSESFWTDDSATETYSAEISNGALGEGSPDQNTLGESPSANSSYPSTLAALLAVPTTATPGKAYIRLIPPAPGARRIYRDGAAVEDERYVLTVEKRDFVAETITLDRNNTNIRVQPDPQKTAESNQLWAILNRTGSEIYARGVFSPPITITRRTSFFGDRRVYRYFDGSEDTAVHAGVDYGAPRGTPVTACALGKVALARNRISTGYTVILEHLPGVYSLYYHLDSIAVEEGAEVPQGTLLGASGSTGLATGPHLHWEIRISGENADPDVLTLRSILDKTAIISRIVW